MMRAKTWPMALASRHESPNGSAIALCEDGSACCQTLSSTL